MEDEEDLLANNYYKITVSQEEKLRSCDYARGDYPENSDSDSSSPPRTPPQQPAIFIMSSPESCSVGQTTAPPEHAASTSKPYLSVPENPRPNGKEQAHIEVIDLDSDEDGDEEGLIRKKTTAPASRLRESNGCLGKRKLPSSMAGCDGGLKIGGVKDLMEVAQSVLEKASHGGESVSLLETAERRGWKFPRPRWWPPEGFND